MTSCFTHAALSITLVVSLAVANAYGEAPATGPSANRQTPIVKAIQRTVKSTVNIHSEKRSRSSANGLFPTGKKVNGMGTGIIIDERGYIVTNYHVVQDVDSLQVTLHDDSTYSARVVSFDSRRDLAVIKIPANRPLEVMPMGTSSDLMLGEDVLAIGNAFGYPHTVTRGIISALGRNVEVNDEQAYENLIQIDAAINPGNSGGPLINRDGEVIGINVAIRAGAQKIGFAIPIDDARRIVARLMDVERVDNLYHGIVANDVKNGAERKLVVQSVKANSPGAKAGLKKGDVILRAGSVDVIDTVDLERAFLGRSPSQQVDIVVQRGDQQETLSIALSALSGKRNIAGRHKFSNTSIKKTPSAHRPSSSRDASDAWRILGLKLSKVQRSHHALHGQTYRGGMLITDVRPGSPAAQNGIRKGDLLVGLHVWETVTPENVDYVLKHPQFASFSPLKFYILRSHETLYGHFQVASK